MRKLSHLLVLLSLVLITSIRADVSLPAIIGENMVLQRGIKVPIWGTAAAGEEVTVTMGAQKATVTADKDGKWKVSIGPLEAGGPFEMTIAGKNTLTLKNILVGEVWVCSGQSNMEFSLKGDNQAATDVPASENSNIRLFTVQKKVSDAPLANCTGKWDLCNPNTTPLFSAVGYYFGRELQKTLNCPIGLIHSSWGGTPAESWTSNGSLEAIPECKAIFERKVKAVENMPNAVKHYEAAVEKWKKDCEAAKAEKKPMPRAPQKPMGPENPWWPSGLYNGMIAPLVPYGIAGAIWYQGESNAGRAYQYRTLFKGMIEDWRKNWGQGEFPFAFVQLANYKARKSEPEDSDWAELREAQSMTLSLPKTGMAVIIDIGEEKDIHPKDKHDVGKRLALWAEATVYGKDVPYSGPMYDSMTVEGNAIRIKFKHVNGGLVTKGDALKGFAIAGEDKKFVWADAKIDGDSVVVSSAKVSAPKAVRYAWADNPECNLYNKADLPASPFRTDSWDGITKDKF